MRKARWRQAVAALTVLVGILAGCRSEVPTYPTRGKVVYKGTNQPFGEGWIWFESTRPPYTRAMAEINRDGEFVLSTTREGNGAIAGEHRVSIAPGNVGSEAGMKAFLSRIDKKYLEYGTSGLRATILPNQENMITIEVTKPGGK
jgi:hypothetical protein